MLALAAGVAGGVFGATGWVQVAAPVVCPEGTVDTDVETVVTHDHDGTGTSYYLDCIDSAGNKTRVSTLLLILVLYGIVALPMLALALIALAGYAVMRPRAQSG